MTSQPAAMLIGKGNWGVPPQFGTRRFTNARRELWPSFIIEGHERAVECGIPKRRQQQAIMHIEPLGVAFAVGPRDDVRRAQQSRIGDPG